MSAATVAVPRRYYRTAIDRGGLGGSVHAVLSALSTSATSSGEIPVGEGPGIDTIAARAGVSRRTAYRALRTAEDAGWLVVDHQRGRHRTNGYRLVVPAGSDAADWWAHLEARAVDQAHAEALAERKPRRRPSTGAKRHRTADRKTCHGDTRVDASRPTDVEAPAPEPPHEPEPTPVDDVIRGLLEPMPDRIRRRVRPRALRAAVRAAIDDGWTDGRALYRRAVRAAETSGLPGLNGGQPLPPLDSTGVGDVTDVLAGRIRKAGAPPLRTVDLDLEEPEALDVVACPADVLAAARAALGRKVSA